MDRRQSSEGNQPKRFKQILDTNLDLDAYSQNYSSVAKIERLLFIAGCCPPLRIDALTLALAEIQSTFLIEKYQDTVQKLNQEKPTDLDLEWISKKSLEATKEQTRLEQELSSYKSNLIKESIRIGHLELGDHFYKTGDLTSALKCYSNTREYLTIPAHIVEMCLKVIEVLEA